MVVSGLVSQAEVETLARLASKVPSGQDVLEIGSYMGKSTVALASHVSPFSRVYAIDLWDMLLPKESKHRTRSRSTNPSFTGAFKEFKKNVAPFADRVTAVKGDSKEIGKVWTRSIGLLFIDGAHDPASVRSDYKNFSPWIIPGGVIAFHDANMGKVRGVIESVVKPSNLWGDWQLVDRIMYASRLPDSITQSMRQTVTL